MIVKAAIPGQYADIDQPVTSALAAAFLKEGYLGITRYLPLTSSQTAGDLTMAETGIILAEGLSLSAVQHVDSPPWSPTAALGQKHGQYAGQRAAEIGLPTGMNLWCDLEEVAAGTSAQSVIDYVSSWATAVTGHGYLPGLYVGWNVVLSNSQLYDLPVKNYWAAYNCDQQIPTRGFQIRQHTAKVLNGISFDPNTIAPDELGSLPMLLYNS
jgi:hypothetical protein